MEEEEGGREEGEVDDGVRKMEDGEREGSRRYGGMVEEGEKEGSSKWGGKKEEEEKIRSRR